MPRAAIEMLSWILDEAFEGDPEHSLLANLRDVGDDAWTAVPPGGARSIADVLEHVGWAKWMYENYAFGDGSLKGDASPMEPPNGARSRPYDDLLMWLREGHRTFRNSVSALDDDAELERTRLTHWRAPMETRALIRILVAHDFYHAGEINHIRALLQGNDQWPY